MIIAIVIGIVVVGVLSWGFRRLYKKGGFKSLVGILEHLAFVRGTNPNSLPGKFR